MRLTGNTVLITGGGTGIGRGLAEAFHKLGNKVIISGRRSSALNEVVAANPGMEAVELDVRDTKGIASVAKSLVARHPALNVLVNNAGIMLVDSAGGVMDEETMLSQVETNLYGPIRLTSALIEHLKTRPDATIIYNSSTVGFTPLAGFAVYCGTKAALHAYAMSQRFLLRETNVRVKEIIPPWVDTGLVGSPEDPNAMPVGRFIDGTMAALATDSEEALVEEARIYRNNVGANEYAYFNQLNEYFASLKF